MGQADAGAAAGHAGPGPGSFALAQTLRGHTRAVSGVAFRPEGDRLLASCSADASLAIWDVQAGKQVTPKAAGGGGGSSMTHPQGINCVAWDPRGRYLASGSDDQTAKLWDAETGACLRTLPGHTNYVFCCQFDPVGHILATGSFDETVRFWDVRCGRCLREIPSHSDPVTGLDFSWDGTLLVTGSFDGLVRLWDARTGACLRTLAVDPGSSPVSFVAFSPSGKYLLQSTLNSTLRLVNVDTGKAARRYSGHTAADFCASAAFVTGAGPRPLVAAGSEDGALLVWDVDSMQVVQRVPGRAAESDPGEGHCAAVLATAAHPQQPMLATGAHEPDCSIRVWRAAGGSEEGAAGGGAAPMALG